jgi:hypothetical protein
MILIILPQSAYAQTPNSRPLGWDLTYSSVLNANHIGREEWIRKWLGRNYESPVKGLISGWNDEPILSSILIEHAGFHAGEHMTLWFVRTKDHAYQWELVKGKAPYKDKQFLSTQAYDNLFAVVSSWQQARTLKAADTPVGGVPGYMGFLSLYDRSGSRQMLLSLEDFYICNTKQCAGGKGGRLTEALAAIVHE